MDLSHSILFQFAVLRLTINNDHNTLKEVLDWGKAKGIEVRWEDDVVEKKSCKGDENPVMIASLHSYQLCTKLLYDYGYRIPQVRCDRVNHYMVSDVDQEEVRQRRILEEPGEDDQVEKFQNFKAYSRPHYLSLLFKEDADLTNLVKIDPLRRALDLAEGAETFSSGLKAISELKKDYENIKDDLECFTTGLLTQCSNMGEITTILKHDPEDDDDDEIDEDGQNWQKALWEGRKALVSHPFFQQFFWKQLIGSFNPNKKGVRGLQRHLGSQHMSAWYWHLLYVPYAILLFCCYPLVVVADLFRKADILFVTPETIQQRKDSQAVLMTSDKERMITKEDEKSPSDIIFEFFRRTIHVPLFRMHVYHVIQFFYLALLLLSIWNPNSILESENQTKTPVKKATSSDKPDNLKQNTLGQWYMVLLTIFTVSYLFEDIVDLFVRKKHYLKSFWNPYSLVTHTLLFTGGFMNFYYYGSLDANKEVKTWERANLPGSHYVNVGMTFVAFAVGMEFFRTLRVLLLFEFLGPIVICMINTFVDALRVFIIYFVIFAAHAVCSWCLYKPFQDAERHNRATGEYPANYTLSQDSLKSKQGLFDAMIWRMLGPEGPERVHIKRYNNATDYDFECKNVTTGTFLCTNKDEDRFSLEFSHLMGVAVWAVYQIIVVILLLNILIAIMNNTYARVWQSADKEWKFGKTYYQVGSMVCLFKTRCICRQFKTIFV